MPIISCPKLKKTIEVPKGANLMEALQDAQIPVASSCGGDGVCAKCRLQIMEGAENLTRETPLEKKLKAQNKFTPDERVSCLTRVQGDISVHADYW